MDIDVAVRTMVPILILMGLGFLSRKLGILKLGDERVLNAYIYCFALPALFIIDLAEIRFTEQNLKFSLAGVLPIIAVLLVYILLYFVAGFSKNTLYLLILSTAFGSLAFFGIPFVVFAFPDGGEKLATLAVASISVVSVAISIVVLELYRLEESTTWEKLTHVAKRLTKNPLIISIFTGLLLSILGVELPFPISASLHMIGTTTAPVAIFMLGVFLYGRRYENITKAFLLSLPRMLLLPALALLTTMLLGVQDLERATLVIMNGAPVAISMIILSERYNFYKETIASLILISSLAAGIYLNLWLLLVGFS